MAIKHFRIHHVFPIPRTASSSGNSTERRPGASSRSHGVRIRNSRKISSLWNKSFPLIVPFALVVHGVLYFPPQTFTGKMSL